jgi:hypothetical protein
LKIKAIAICMMLALLVIGTVVQADSTYKLDDGTSSDSIGIGPMDLWWGNAFSVVSGAEKITAIQISMPFANTKSFVNIGDVFRVLLYSDTDGDGNPTSGLTLLQNVVSTVQNTGVIDTWQTIDIPDTIVSGVFFVAAMTSGPSDTYFPASIDMTTSAGKSWCAFVNHGTMDLANVGSDASMNTIDSYNLPGNWMLRAEGSPAAVPEASTLIGFGSSLLMAGPGMIGWLRRRRA